MQMLHEASHIHQAPNQWTCTRRQLFKLSGETYSWVKKFKILNWIKLYTYASWRLYNRGNCVRCLYRGTGRVMPCLMVPGNISLPVYRRLRRPWNSKFIFRNEFKPIDIHRELSCFVECSSCINGSFECYGSTCRCNEDQFQCYVDGKCVDKTKVCDRIFDCQDHSDEDNCTRKLVHFLGSSFLNARVYFYNYGVFLNNNRVVLNLLLIPHFNYLFIYAMGIDSNTGTYTVCLSKRSIMFKYSVRLQISRF